MEQLLPRGTPGRGTLSSSAPINLRRPSDSGSAAAGFGRAAGSAKKGEYSIPLSPTSRNLNTPRRRAGRWPCTTPSPCPILRTSPYLLSDPGGLRAQAYDLVLNGVELGSGSIRIHRKEIQQRMFEALGFTDEQIVQRFGLWSTPSSTALRPTAAFCLGLDRLAMLLLGRTHPGTSSPFPRGRTPPVP